MKTTEATAGIPPDLAAELLESLDDLARGIRRPEKMQAACAWTIVKIEMDDQGLTELPVACLIISS